jgi:hypothetical protein
VGIAPSFLGAQEAPIVTQSGGRLIVCEHTFLPKGSLHAHFQRSIERGHLLSAETAARQLPKPIALADALALLLLIAVEDPARYSRAAARWHGRFVVECGLSLEDDALALAALSAVRFSSAALVVLAELGSRYRIANIEGALRRFRATSR